MIVFLRRTVPGKDPLREVGVVGKLVAEEVEELRKASPLLHEPVSQQTLSTGHLDLYSVVFSCLNTSFTLT